MTFEEKVFGDVSLSTLVSYALEDQSKLPTIVKDLLALEINYIIDNVRTAVDTGNVYIGNIVKTICKLSFLPKQIKIIYPFLFQIMELEFLLRIYHACLTKASLEKTDAAIPSQPGLGCI